MPKNNSKAPVRSSGKNFTFTDPTAGKDYSFPSFSGDYSTSAGTSDMRINLPSMPEGSGVSTSVDGATITSGGDYRTEAQKVRQKYKAERVQRRQELRNKKQEARIEKRTRKFEDPEGYKADKKAEREAKKKARKQERLDKKQAKLDAKKQELNSTQLSTGESPATFLGNTLAGIGGIVSGGVTGTGTQPATQALQRRGGMLANIAAQTQAAQAEQQGAAGAAGSVMPTGGGKFQLTPVAMKTYDPPMQANEKGMAAPQFNSAVKASANYLYGTPAQRQASVGSMFQLSESQMKAFGPGGSHENPELLAAIKKNK